MSDQTNKKDDHPQGHRNTTLYADDATLRDYFAAKAMEALIHASFKAPGADAIETAMGKVCEAAYEMADEMIRVRNKKP